jgi:hypothetical protein
MLGPARLVRPTLISSVLIILFIMITWGRYKRSARTQPYAEVLDRLVQSDEEYCLILRPFGSDGEIVVPHSTPGAATIEQVISRAARKSLGLRTYAIVDQGRRLAPPGPTYLRAPNDEWQLAVRTLIRRAHSIVLVLPPGQEIRDSFRWEINQLAGHRLQSRVTIVLPPDRLYPDDYPLALRQACLLVDRLEGFTVHGGDLEPPERTHVLKFCRSKAFEDPQLRFWDFRSFIEENQPKVLRWVKWGVWIPFYRSALRDAFRTTEDELSTLSFAARYRSTMSE